MIRTLSLLLVAALLLSMNGCALAAVAAHAVPQYSQPKYTGLAGQSIGVMVWADMGIKIDWPSLSLDTANSLTGKLAQLSLKEPLLKDSTFPVKPASIVRFQMDHPEIEAADISEVAPRLGVNRLIYIEVEEFATRAVDSVELFRGSMNATIRVVECDGKVGRVVYEENNIRCVFPHNVPDEGQPRGNDYQFYTGTVNAFTDELLSRFVPVEIP